MMITRALTTLLVIALASPAFAGQPRATEPAVWRALAESVSPGSPIRIQLTDGRRFTAVLVEAQADAVLLQPKTRMAVPVQAVRCGVLRDPPGPDGGVRRSGGVQFALPAMSPEQPLVAVIMGSSSDWETMQHAVEMLERLGVPHERHIVSAHRTPVWMAEFAGGAEARGIEVIIAGAGGAAHLPGMVAAHTLLPVLGVPVQSAALQGLDSLLSIVQMPGGVPVGTLAIGKPGAINAAILAVSIVSNSRPELRARLRAFRDEQTQKVRQEPLP